MKLSSGSQGRRVFMGFMLSGQEYGLDCARVQQLGRIVTCEGGLADVAGLAGSLVPIVDLRCAFGAPGSPEPPEVDVMLLRVGTGLVGMVVEGITGLLYPRLEAVQPVAGRLDQDYFIGTTSVGRRRVLLLDIDRLMALTPPARIV